MHVICRSSTGTSSNQPPLQQLSLPAPPVSNSSATSLAIVDPNIDLLSGEDYSKPATENMLALVPVSEPLTNSASDQNILALSDMFSNTSAQVNNNNPTNVSDSSLTLSAPQAYPSVSPLQLQPQLVQQPAPYPNGNNPGPPRYEHAINDGSQLNQANTVWNGQVIPSLTSQQATQGYGKPNYLLDYFSFNCIYYISHVIIICLEYLLSECKTSGTDQCLLGKVCLAFTLRSTDVSCCMRGEVSIDLLSVSSEC